MTTPPEERERAALRGLLRAMDHALGASVPADWRRAVESVPRHLFLPETIWCHDPGHGGLKPIHRATDPDGWLAAAYADEPVITQVNDGQDPGDVPWPSSSASDPSIVLRMLALLDADSLGSDERVLEIGTGTGYNAALLAHRLGASRVVSVEVDRDVAARARRHLAAAGVRPRVVRADGYDGWAPGAPYARIVATCAVRRVPPAWIQQTAPGGRVVTPWDNPWISYGLLTLTVDGDHAEGRFLPHACFMLMRRQRTALDLYRDVVHDEHTPQESTTGLDPDAVAGDDADAQFAVGMRLRDVWHVWHHEPDVAGVAARLWLATTDGTSWAAVDWDGDDYAVTYAVAQHGPRRLWTEAETAYAWWQGAGRPGPERFGLTVSAAGEQRGWLDEPGRSWPLG